MTYFKDILRMENIDRTDRAIITIYNNYITNGGV